MPRLHRPMEAAAPRQPSVHAAARRSALAAIGCAVLLAAATRPASALPENFWYENTIDGLQLPTNVQFARDGRVFITEKRGVIKVYDSLQDDQPDVFADLRTKVHNHLDRGLLGLALHPQFPEVPYVYVAYAYDGSAGLDVDDAPRWGTVDTDDDPCPSTQGCPVTGRLSRLTADGNAMVGETVLISDWFQQHPNHAMDNIAFGADGYLYLSAGEGATAAYVDDGRIGHPDYPDTDSPDKEGGSLRSQDLETMSDPLALTGTIIRVDPLTGEAAADNPLAGDADANARRIVAYGLRNPFRFAVRPGTSELWIGDVGAEAFEEINVLPDPASAAAPLNFGWPCYEGEPRQGGFEQADLPICTAMYAGTGRFPHTPPWRDFVREATADDPITAGSISALAFYAGSAWPERYHRALFFADFVTDRIYAVPDLDGDGVPDGPDAIDVFAEGASGIVSLVPGPGGDLFFTQLFSGRLVRIRHGDNTPPVAALALGDGSDWQGPPRTVAFDASASYDPDAATGEPLAYAWDLDGDGSFDDGSNSSSVTHDYTVDGSYQVGLRVTDIDGASDTVSLRITVGDAVASARIAAPSADYLWRTGETLTLRADGNDASGAALPDSAYQWNIVLLHCATGPDDCHQHPLTGGSGRELNVLAPEHEFPSYLRIALTATVGGETLTDQFDLTPQTARLTLQTEPAGLSLSFGSAGTEPTPFQREVIVGSAFTIAAPLTQPHDGSDWQFHQWSNGGERQHSAAVDSAGELTLTATYRLTGVFGDGFESPSP